MYNSENTIIATLNSVVNQTYQAEIEVLIINDGSIDNSAMIVKKYIEDNRSDNISFRLINKNNGGVSSARNVGIKESKGKWIALLDSDDVWLPEKLEKQMQVLKENEHIKILGTNRNDEVYPWFGKSKLKIYNLTAKETLLKWWPSTPTVIFKKEIIEKTGVYNESLRGLEDGEFWLRILKTYKIYVLNEYLVLTGHGKRSFGDIGLSADLGVMHSGEKAILAIVYKNKQINYLEYLFFQVYLSLKYFRRLLVVRLAK